MREILFRGKDVHTGNWVEGWYEKSCFGRWPLLHSIIPAQDAEEGHLHHVPVYPESVGQYTGLTDKNGKRIFEGDMVTANLPATVAQPEYSWGACAVVFQDGCFGVITSREFIPFRSFAPRVEFEVIGNIYNELKEGTPIESKGLSATASEVGKAD